jgi:Fe2+ transport system protein FeoA
MNHFEVLSDLKVGEEGKIHKYTNDVIASKLLSMGVLPGKSVRLVRRIPFGGGLYIKVEDHNIAVREEEAKNIVLIVI